MKNQRNGLKFEGYIRKKLMDYGMIVLNLASNSYGDLITLNPLIMIEVKKTHRDKYYLTHNINQFYNLNSVLLKGIPVFYCIGFTGATKTDIRFYDMKDINRNDSMVLSKDKGYSISEFVNLWSE
jgi:Holliday junction resolvase